MAKQDRKSMILIALAIAIVCGGGVAFAGKIAGGGHAAAPLTPSSAYVMP
ncbi:MAG: hypothetical protein J6C59_07180 [Muribaculaceae bacterium]|nr:hypothetical protein [Muribaculaceae bacterium]